jgi:trk system potassium uptake protein TrkA
VATLPAVDSVFLVGDLPPLAALGAELPSVERTLDGPPTATEH